VLYYAARDRNKEILKKIGGHRMMIREHRAKMENELRNSNPDRGLIAYWQKRIHIVELEILRLEERLRKH
jgi:hypothetical protein